jgi:hypothetical protein
MSEEEQRLANAVYKTVNHKLDPPPFIFWPPPYDDEEKLIDALGDTSKYVQLTPRGNRYHPLVIDYYKQWGDRYLDGLRASRRLLS